MTITLHFGHWWLYVLAAVGGLVIGGIVVYALFVSAVKYGIGKGMNW